jgi:hypothetical protein
MGKFENSERLEPRHPVLARRLLWPGQRQFYLKSASGLRSTAICRPSFNPVTRVHLLRFMASADGLPVDRCQSFWRPAPAKKWPPWPALSKCSLA